MSKPKPTPKTQKPKPTTARYVTLIAETIGHTADLLNEMDTEGYDFIQAVNKPVNELLLIFRKRNTAT